MKKTAAVLLILVLLLASGTYASEAVGDSGVNYIERMGIGFSLSGTMQLKQGDILETKVSSHVSVRDEDVLIVMNESTVLKIEQTEPLAVTLERGEIYLQAGPGTGVILRHGGTDYDVSGCTLAADMLEGSSNITVLSGATGGISAGQRLTEAGGEKMIGGTESSALNTFIITCALDHAEDLCFSAETLNGVVSGREAERLSALEEESDPIGGGKKRSVCTLQIKCNTILDNMADLTEGKNAYVPPNGVILATSRISFDEGETVFDVLKRACKAAGIQIEYSYTPMYGSYYIEGINHLYEFDCGQQSGWMYKVNGWFPNYGCSSYTLKDGDSIVWCYTCKGLGADVGGSVY